MNEVKTIKRSEVKIDERLQARMWLLAATTKRYAEMYSEAGLEALPPITVYRVDEGGEIALYVVDGFHRIAALEQAGLDTVMATVIDGTWPAAVCAAAVANIEHGEPLNAAGRKRAFMMLMEHDKHFETLSQRGKAKRLGVHHSTIGDWQAELTPSTGGNPPVEKTIGADGKARNTANIAAANRTRAETDKTPAWKMTDSHIDLLREASVGNLIVMLGSPRGSTALQLESNRMLKKISNLSNGRHSYAITPVGRGFLAAAPTATEATPPPSEPILTAPTERESRESWQRPAPTDPALIAERRRLADVKAVTESAALAQSLVIEKTTTVLSRVLAILAIQSVPALASLPPDDLRDVRGQIAAARDRLDDWLLDIDSWLDDAEQSAATVS